MENFARGKIEVQQLEITAGAKAIGRTLVQLNVGSETGVRVGLIQRQGDTFVQNRDTIIELGDELTLFGNPNSLSKIQ